MGRATFEPRLEVGRGSVAFVVTYEDGETKCPHCHSLLDPMWWEAHLTEEPLEALVEKLKEELALLRSHNAAYGSAEMGISMWSKHFIEPGTEPG